MQLPEYTNLRGGVISKATGVKSVTFRSWATDLQQEGVFLKIGKTEPGAQPRYDLSDVAKLILMEHLTFRIGMSAGIAIRIVNHIPMKNYVAEVLSDLAQSKAVDRKPKWFLVFEDKHKPIPRILLLAEILETFSSPAIANVIIDIKGVINRARYRLDQTLSISENETPCSDGSQQHSTE